MDESNDQRLEELRHETQGAGLTTLAGFMIAATAAPFALKSLARARVIGRLAGRGLMGGGAETAERLATKLEGYRSAALRTEKTLASVEAAVSRGIRGEAGMDRVRMAARNQLRAAGGETGKINISRFLDESGIWSGATRLDRRAGLWHQFKADARVKSAGVARSLFDPATYERYGGQRALVRSFAAQWGKEQLTIIPAIYGLERATGLTTGQHGEAPAWWNLPGNASHFINWLPTYAAFDVAGRAAFALPALAKGAMKPVSSAIRRQPRLGQAAGAAYAGIERMVARSRDVTTPLRNAYQQRIRPAGSPVQQLFSEKTMQLATRLRTRMAKRMATKSKYALHKTPSLMAAKQLFGSKFVDHLSSVAEDTGALNDALGLVEQQLLPGAGSPAAGGFARFFGGKAVTVGELRSQATKESEEMITALERQMTTSLTGLRKKINDGTLKSKRVAEFVERFEKAGVGSMRVSGYARIGDQVVRTPTGGEIRHLANRAMTAMTGVRIPGKKGHRLSLFQIFNLHTLSEGRSPIQVVQGGLDVDGQAHYFERLADSALESKGAAKRLSGFQLHETGLAVSAQADGTLTRLFGMNAGKMYEVSNEALLPITNVGGGKIHRIMMRKHYYRAGIDPQSRPPGVPDQPRMLSWLFKTLHMGDGLPESQSRIGTLFNKLSPRRLFAPGSSLWSSREPIAFGTSHEAVRRQAEFLPDSVRILRQALRDSGDVYTNREVFEAAVKGLGETINTKDIGLLLENDELAASSAEHIFRNLTSHFGKDAAGMRPPSTFDARKILQEMKDHPDHLYNMGGRARGQVLRQFIFEQGVLGLSSADGAGLASVRETIDRLVTTGGLSRAKATEAKAGLVFLDLQKKISPLRTSSDDFGLTFLRDPYKLGGMAPLRQGSIIRTMQETLDANRSDLHAFAANRPRVDWNYRRTAPIDNAPIPEANFGLIRPSAAKIGGLWMESALDTTREALGHIGYGWDPKMTVLHPQGQAALKDLWLKRAGRLAMAVGGYSLVDTALDVMLPDEAPLGEGLTPAIAGAVAQARLAGSYMADALGVDAAARYMEGLMPKSTSIIPGAAVGFALGGWKGALLGGVVNRVTSETLRDTPIEALSFVLPLAPFVTDLTESYDETLAKYEGRELVPVRKGRYFMLSSSDYAGGRVSSWRPNWYVRAKRDYESTPVLYGSKIEKLIHKDLPLIDFSIGDLFDPSYLTKRHYWDRPYVEPDRPFSDVPFIGPMLGATLGKAYLALHPMASNEPMHMEEMVGGIRGHHGRAVVGSPISGFTVFGDSAGTYQDESMGPAFLSGGTIVGANSARATIDEQFYRMTEAMGFTGFVTQQLAGGEGLFRDDLLASASDMTSFARKYHDLDMGDMMGIGEAMRRLYPFVRNAERLGPRNTMPDWMPDGDGYSFQHGDPYCLTPDCLIEINEELIPALDAHMRIEAGEKVYARTHRGRLKPVVASAVRDVNEEIVHLEFEGLPWPLRVTAAHPVLVMPNIKIKDRTPVPIWKLAGDIVEGDEVLAPGGPAYEAVDTRPYEPARKVPTEKGYTLPHDAITGAALGALTRVQPSKDVSKWLIHGLDEDDEHFINMAFRLEGSKYYQREKRPLVSLRRQMAEWGLPPSIVGMTIAALRPLLLRWGTETETSFDVTLDFERLGLTPNPAWSARDPYIPTATPQTALERAAYTLWRACREADIPAELEISEGRATLPIRGRWATRVLYTQFARSKEVRLGRHMMGHEKLRNVNVERSKALQGLYSVHKVEVVRREAYTGPVYAFEVEGDASFVAAGVATHNSKIAMGEALLPGAGFETFGRMVGQRELNVSELGEDAYETAMNMLSGGRLNEDSEEASWAKERAAQQLIAYGMGVQEDVVYTEEKSRLVGIASVATRGKNPILIEALDDATFRSTNRPRALDMEKVNALLGVARRTQGMMVYVNEETGEMAPFVQRFDSGLYNASLEKLQVAELAAREAAAAGYGAPGAMYSTVDRMQILLNAAPFSKEWRVEARKAKAFEATGAFSMAESARYRELLAMQEKMTFPFEIYPRRFGVDQLFDPDETVTNLTYNESIKAAAEYSLPERIAGSVWEHFCVGPDTPVETPIGQVRIDEIRQGMPVLGTDGAWHLVEQVHRRALGTDEPIIWLETEGVTGRLLITPNHEVMAVKQRYCTCTHGASGAGRKLAQFCPICREQYRPSMYPAGELIVGDFLALRIADPRRIGQRLDLLSLYSGDALVDVGGRLHYRSGPARRGTGGLSRVSIPRYIERDDLPDFFELIGWYLAEGSTSDHLKALQFTLHVDEIAYATRIADIAERLFGCTTRHDERPHRSTRHVTLSSRVLGELFAQFGKKHWKVLPLDWVPYEQELGYALLRGYLLGDGYMDAVRGRVVIGTACDGIASRIRHLLAHLGFMTSAGKRQKKENDNGIRKDGSVAYRYTLHLTGEDAERLWPHITGEPAPFQGGPRRIGHIVEENGDRWILHRIDEYSTHLRQMEVYDLTVAGVPAYSTPWGTVHNSSLRTPLHSKFFGVYNLEQQYQNRVLLGRDFQSWSEPIDDFVMPYMRGLAAADDPLQGGLSYGIGGLLFGGGLYGMIGAAAGTVYGAVHGGYRAMTNSTYIPGEIQEVREVEQQFDRIRYYRAKHLYDATGDPQFMDEMQKTATGWTQDGLSRTGWAKERRLTAAPANRLEHPLYQGDRGFGSPWSVRNVQKFVKSFAELTRRTGSRSIQTIGPVKNRIGRALSMGERPVVSTIPHAASARPAVMQLAAAQTDMATTRAARLINHRARTTIMPMEGMPESGFAAATRSLYTAFGSPWRGTSPAEDIAFRAGDNPNALPPEAYTAISAAPESEKQFMRAALLLRNPDDQDRFLRMVSPDMAAMLDVGYNYLYDQPLRGTPMDPMTQYDYGLTGNAVMGMGAYVEGYQVRTMEDIGLDAHDAGLGWKQAMLRLNSATVAPESVAGVMAQKSSRAPSAAELEGILKRLLLQLGITAQVDVTDTAGHSTDIHLVQST